ncbi:MAG: helix-turn-helix transcriptional regulator [Muribaculaceae bacterium]
MTRVELGKIINSLRKDQGITRDALSLSSGVSVRALHNIEKAQFAVTFERLQSIVTALGGTIEIQHQLLNNEKKD